MHELKEMLKPIKEMQHKLIEWTEEEFDKGKHCVDTKEAGEVVDMIKDLAEAEEKCMKACYYKKIIEAMDEAEEMGMTETPEMPWHMKERAGYDHYRYPSSGRFSPKGSGKRYGYIPTIDPMMGHDMGDKIWDDGRTSSYGKSYDRYQESRRHYTDTKSPKDKDDMNRYANEHIGEAIGTIRAIWDDADPDLRKRMKNDIAALSSQMTS